MTAPTMDDPRVPAAIDLIGRTGATSIQVRYSDDEQPTVWMAVACYGDRHETDAAMDPATAVLRLAERMVDGGSCTHCRRPTGLLLDLDTAAGMQFICWYQWDPELNTFRRGCEGDDR